MKCSGCGQEFPNVAAVTKHKLDCPGKKEAEDPKDPGAPVEGGTVVTGAPKETKEPHGPEPAPADPLAEAMDRQRMMETIENYARILGLKVVKDDEPKLGEAVIDMSHLPNDVLAGLYRNAELKFEVIGVLDNDNRLHVHDVRYPRRGR